MAIETMAGHWPPRAGSRGAVTLDFRRPRIAGRLTLAQPHRAARTFLLDLPRGAGAATTATGWRSTMAAGSRCVAAPEALMEVTAHDAGASRAARLAYRQPPSAGADRRDRILIRDDQVIADMLAGLGAHVHRMTAPF